MAFRTTMPPELLENLRLEAELLRHVRASINREIFIAFERLDAPPDLLSIIGSYGDTLDDSEVLRLLQEYNRTGKVIHERQ